MNHFVIHRTMAVLISLCLLVQPAFSAYAPIPAASSENAVSAPSSSEELNSASTANAVHADSLDQLNAPSTPTSVTFPKTLITMDFQDADVHDVLHLMALKSGLNIIYGSDVTGAISVHLDRVPFDQAFQTVLTLKSLVALPMGARIIRVISATGLTAEQSQAATFTRVFRLNYSNAQDLKAPIDAIRSAAGRKGVSSVDATTNSIIITDTLEGLKQVEELIPTLDRKPQQVDIEAKVVEVTLSNSDKLGIAWQYAGAGGSNNAYKIGSTNAATGSSAAGINTNPSANVVSANPPGVNGGTGVDFANALGTMQNSALTFLTQQGTYLLSAQLTALAIQDRVKILSTPHVVTLNNQEANIAVVDNIPYSVVSITNGTASSTSIQFVQAGVKLTVKPIVNADRRITLHVKPEVSNAAGTTFTGAPPVINTRDADTTVLLRDGETIAIGGLITERTEKTVNGIPILMNIPILGNFFKSTDDEKDRDELIVFLTPKIAGE